MKRVFIHCNTDLVVIKKSIVILCLTFTSYSAVIYQKHDLNELLATQKWSALPFWALCFTSW